MQNYVTLQSISPAPAAWYDLWVNYDSLIRIVSSHDNPTAAQQIISVATGQTVTLSSSKTFETTASITYEASAPTEKISGGITQKIGTTYTTTIQWTGPSSPYISRNYYWTGFRDYGTYSITGYGNISGDKYGPYAGSYYEPTTYEMWSLDLK